MTSELFIGLHGSEDPTKATLPFIMANAAIQAGHETGIILIGDAVTLMDSAVPANVHGVGFPTLGDIMEKVIAAKVPIFV